MFYAGETYVAETQRVAELSHKLQHLALTQGLKKFSNDTQWTVENCHLWRGTSRICKPIARPYLEVWRQKDDRIKIMKTLGRALLDELENLFRSYWVTLDPSAGASRMVCSKSPYWDTASSEHVPSIPSPWLWSGHTCTLTIFYFNVVWTISNQLLCT